MIAIILFASLFTYSSAKLHCPFYYWRDRPCLRDLDEPQRNQRPEILINNATDEELESEEKCCYERYCLLRCNIYDVMFSDFVNKQLFTAGELVVEYPHFFQNVDWEEINSLQNRTASARVKSVWRIRIAHFEVIKQKWEIVKHKLKELNKLFGH